MRGGDWFQYCTVEKIEEKEVSFMSVQEYGGAGTAAVSDVRIASDFLQSIWSRTQVRDRGLRFVEPPLRPVKKGKKVKKEVKKAMKAMK